MLTLVKYIIVLANEMDSAGVLNDESMARADFAGKLAVEHPESILITPGWAYRSDSAVRIGSSMAKYLMQNLDISTGRVVSHLDSKDTVGDAVYCRDFLDKTKAVYSLEVVTSDYHVERALSIFSFVFGESFEVTMHSVPTEKPLSRLEAERASTEAYLRTFVGIAPGDFKAIKFRLFSSHPLYATKA
jgi:uncharacterized SAM-binding protein YcdF (DUF218 family)